MTKMEFLDSLNWKEGKPPAWADEGFERSLKDGLPSMAIKVDSGEILILGDCNSSFGICDDCTEFDRTNIVAYAYFWEEE
jgi:hypothetical protein